MTRTTIAEATSTSLPAVPESSGRLAVQIITPGWGSSGHYSAGVLESAAQDRIFPAGTRMFLDHPSESERYDRPERSVKDLAAVLTEDARWTGDALVAPVQVFGPYRDVLAEMKDAIGVSIRAAAEVTEGEAEGRRGVIVDRLVEGVSVDFVTQAGRGGRILQVLESARDNMTVLTREAALAHVQEARNIGQWIESRLHLSLTQIADDMFGDGRLTREERIALSGAVGDGLTAFTAALEQGAPQLYARDLWDEPAVLVATATESVPVNPAGRSTPTEESEEDTMGQISIEETEHRRLVADAGRVTALESERDTARTERDAVARELATQRARNTATSRARGRVTEANATLAPATVDRIVAQATATVPLTDAGQLDEAALDTATDTARTAEEAYLASLAEASGAGTVRGFGSGTTQVDESVDVTAIVAGAFGRSTKEA